MTEFGPHHADQIVQAHRRLDAHDARINKMEVDHAREAERSIHIQKSLGEIQSGITWITRLVIGGIIAGIVTFVLAGGLNVGS